jgi:hypothetical protein
MQQKEIDIGRIKELPFFFIVGSPRSGTTLLRTIFDAHPNVNIPFEFPFILYFYEKYGHVTNWNEKDILSFYEDITKNIKFEFWSFAGWRINPDDLKKNMLKYIGLHSYSELCKSIYYQFNSYFTKKTIQILGDKNPTYSTRIELLMQLFPDSKFIHITRDYRDHILSMQNVDFGGKLTPMIAYRWHIYQRTIFKMKKKYQNNVLSIKYENLVSDPMNIVSIVCDFLNIPFDPEIINIYKHKEGMIQTYGLETVNKYHSSLLNPISSDNIYAWKNKMPEKEIKIADMVVGKWAEKYGYERKYKGFYPLLFLYVIPIYVHLVIQKFLWIFIKILPHKTKNKIVYRNSIFEKWYEKIYVRLRGI